MKLILLGPPGAGKGTQAKLICKELDIPAISTGNILREAIADKTPTGIKAKEFIDNGRLVPDDVVLDIIRERLSRDDCKQGFLLDGFPRTIPQAEALDGMGVKLDKVISVEVEDADIVNRMAQRRICSKCGATYSLSSNKPKVDGVCDDCGAELICRKDDAPETVKERLSIYHEVTEPLKSFYRESGRLACVDGNKSVDEVFGSITEALGLKL